LCLRTLFWNINEFSDVMGMLKAIGVEKSYSRNGSQSKMIPIELDYDGYTILYILAFKICLKSYFHIHLCK